MELEEGRQLDPEGDRVDPMDDLVGSDESGGELLRFSAEVDAVGREPSCLM